MASCVQNRLYPNEVMQDLAARLAGGLVDVELDLDREFESRLAETSTLAFRVAYSVLRHRQDAEDVAQEAYTRAYRRFRSLRDRGRFRAWLVRMTWRLALDHRRAHGRRTAREMGREETETQPTAADRVVAQERATSLWQAIDTLPEKLQMVVVLAAIEEHDLAHVAALLRVPVGTVKSRLFQARQQLKERLQCLESPSR